MEDFIILLSEYESCAYQLGVAYYNSENKHFLTMDEYNSAKHLFTLRHILLIQLQKYILC